MGSLEGYPPLLEVLSTEDEIEAAVGKPAPRMLAKVVDSLDDICRAFIARSPFIVVASSDSGGRCDVSPKGDLPGFVQILDSRTIAIPERPGNRRADTFRNVLQNPRVGLMFIVPGKGETLRVSGTARVVRDAWLREQMAVDGRLPELALVVTVEEAFIHCTKCMVRSRMWQPDSWNDAKLATAVEALIVHSRLDMAVAELQSLYENDVRTRLY
jgi:PPOX class probable FMN-dependent enzyme